VVKTLTVIHVGYFLRQIHAGAVLATVCYNS
jgi:hypothetical protein